MGKPAARPPPHLPHPPPRRRPPAPRPAAGECESGDLRRYMLKPIREMPFIGLMEDLRDNAKVGALAVP